MAGKEWAQAKFHTNFTSSRTLVMNGTSAVRDVAIRGGKIAAVAPHLDSKLALKTVSAAGLYVTPGLVDMHEHVYAGTGDNMMVDRVILDED